MNLTITNESSLYDDAALIRSSASALTKQPGVSSLTVEMPIAKFEILEQSVQGLQLLEESEDSVSASVNLGYYC